MTRVWIAWFLGALLVGYLGRKRRAGFWGSFFFSLLFTPIVGALALILAAPSRQEKDKQVRAVRAAAASAAPGVRATRLGSVAASFIVPWILLVAVFTAVFAVTLDAERTVWERGFTLSLDMATLGLSGFSSAAASGVVRTAMAVERLGVLLILATAVTRVLGSRSDSRIRQMRSSLDETIGSLEAANRTQREELERLRAAVAQASAPRAEPAVTASATVSH